MEWEKEFVLFLDLLRLLFLREGPKLGLVFLGKQPQPFLVWGRGTWSLEWKCSMSLPRPLDEAAMRGEG